MNGRMNGHVNQQQAFFDALLDPDTPAPAGLSTWNDSDPAVRFAVYRNNVVASLIDALADTFPVVQELVGEPFFRAMARLFIQTEPPRSPVLAYYGESFPEFIERFPPAASVPYLVDVARLEMLRVQAYHAIDRAPLTPEMINRALANPEALPDLVLEFHPSMALLHSRYAVVSLWSAHQGNLDIATINPLVPESALIIRPELEVEVRLLNPGTADFIKHLLAGTTLCYAAERVAEAHAEFDLVNSLGLLIQSQAITSMNTTNRNP